MCYYTFIGASLSEPHTCGINVIYMYIIIFVAIRPTNQGPAAANFLIYCTLRKKYLNFHNMRINMVARFSLSIATLCSVVGMVRLKAIHGKQKGFIFQ